ncbi:MAG: nicotinate (nicotinamide) nucleotide adenylyltransferase [Candidatus Riflebacteria bacterium]|nr:nicotinate (nicotinamide) nucleotide adenylyltransferase [Candidatus Riflebacteria bacterium]
MRIGILGGSFDPAHNQHVQLGLAALLEGHLDEVWYVPVFQAVHKHGHALLDYRHRRALLHKALREFPQSRICDIEMELGGPSYTFRTLEFLRERYPEHEFYLIIGGDSLSELPTWMKIEQIVAQTEFIVVERPGVERVSPLDDAIVHWAPCLYSAVSSTAIRAAVQQHDFSFAGLDSEVLFEILQHDYYGSLGDNFRHWLKVIMHKQEGVAAGLREHMHSATRLAVKYALEVGCDPRLALVAGMAHDLFRDADDAEIINLVSSTHFLLSDLEKQTPMLAHGPAAAAWLLQVCPDIDSTIISAVKNHTFPQPDSPLLTRILSTADTLDPIRQIDSRDQIRESGISFEERFQKVLQIKKTSHS